MKNKLFAFATILTVLGCEPNEKGRKEEANATKDKPENPLHQEDPDGEKPNPLGNPNPDGEKPNPPGPTPNPDEVQIKINNVISKYSRHRPEEILLNGLIGDNFSNEEEYDF